MYILEFTLLLFANSVDNYPYSFQLSNAPNDKITAVVDSYHLRPRTSPVNNPSIPQILPEKDRDKDSPKESSMLARLASHNNSVSKSERAKVVSELAVMRNTIDILPEINVIFELYIKYLDNFHNLHFNFYSG